METDADNEAEQRIGSIVDKRYRITGILGRGGMGVVYRAEHITIKKPIALKLLHSSMAHIEQLTARFEREAFTAGRVDHPNCVTAQDFGVLEDGGRYLVMELLEGESLGTLLDREGSLPVDRALHITRHLLHGLRYAHNHGVVHRDIKPENVILEAKDDDPCFARLVDFGIAKLLGEAEVEAGGEKLTQAGIAFGTPVYMSPEQAYGEPIDPRADLYALSVLLFEMLTGHAPFEDEDKMAVLQMHAGKPPPTFKEVAPDRDFPAGVEALVRRGLEKRRDDRYANADEYLDALVKLMPDDDALWAERTPTSMRSVLKRPQMTTPLPTPVVPAPRRRRFSPLEIALVVTVSIVGFMFILFVVVIGDDTKTDAKLQKYTNTLANAPTCEERKQAVDKLRALGDKRAIPALRQARDRRAKSGSPESNKCLRREAIQAILELQNQADQNSAKKVEGRPRP